MSLFNENKIGIFIIIFVIITPLTLAVDANEYISEFNNDGETCSLIDTFYYEELRPSFFGSSYKGTVPVIYSCCENDNCIGIVFDIYHQNFLYGSSVQEIIDLNYIKHALQTGELSQYEFISKGIDVCQPFGKEKLNEQTISLVAETTETIALMQETKKAKQVADTIKLAKSVSLISPLNLAELGVSVACNIQNKKLETALETLAECNMYLENIAYAKARTGYVNELNSCLVNARGELSIYLDSDGAKIKHALDKTGNAISGFFSFLNNLANNPSESHEFTIEETEYEIAQKVNSEIKNKEILLHHPNNEEVFNKYVNRVLNKREDYNISGVNISFKIENLSHLVPNSIEIFLTNIFYEPNYNISEGVGYFHLTESKIKECNELFEIHKYNSAMTCLKEAEDYYNYATPIIHREDSIKRTFDWWAFLIFLFVIGAIFFIIRHIKRRGSYGD